MMESAGIAFKAIESVSASVRAFCKFLSANDSGETGAHQSGILVSKRALRMLFDKDAKELDHIEKRRVKIRWQDDFETESTFTYYESKGELRITSFGRGFPFLNKEDTGALFVFTEQDREHYCGFFLFTDDDINSFLDAFRLSPTETNDLIAKEKERNISETHSEYIEIQGFINSITVNYKTVFPDSYTMSRVAREIENKVESLLL